MIARSMIAGAALFALTTGTSLAAEKAATSAAPPAAKGSHKDLSDHEGNSLSVDLDDLGKIVKATGKNKRGEPIEVVHIPMKNMSICIPTAAAGGATLCQPLVFATEGTFFKFGNATCTCGVIGGYPFCYGKDCK